MQVHRYPRLHRSQVSAAVHTMAFQVLLFAMPLSLFIPGCFFSIWNASLIFLSLVCLALSLFIPGCFFSILECFSDLSLPRVFGMVQDGDLRPFDFVWLLIVAVKHMFSHSRLWVDQSNSVSVLFAAYVECPHGFSNVLLFTSIALDWVHYMCWVVSWKSILNCVRKSSDILRTW